MIAFFATPRFRHYIIFLATAVGLSISSRAQTSTWSKESIADKKTKTKLRFKDIKAHAEKWGMDASYKHTFLLGGKLNSDGWSGTAYILKRKSSSLSSVWHISFSEVKHEKQIKQKGKAAREWGPSVPYVFGKINNLYTLQLGWGRERLLLPSVLEGNTSVAFRYTAGFSLAMLKPYYLRLLNTTATPAGRDSTYIRDAKYSRADSAAFLNTNSIYGSARWRRGLDEIELIPGAYTELAVVLQPGKPKAFVQSITLGANAAVYYSTLPVMANNPALRWHACLFAGLAVGKRWK